MFVSVGPGPEISAQKPVCGGASSIAAMSAGSAWRRRRLSNSRGKIQQFSRLFPRELPQLRELISGSTLVAAFGPLLPSPRPEALIRSPLPFSTTVARIKHFVAHWRCTHFTRRIPNAEQLGREFSYFHPIWFSCSVFAWGNRAKRWKCRQQN